jgi:hypothetical protein
MKTTNLFENQKIHSLFKDTKERINEIKKETGAGTQNLNTEVRSAEIKNNADNLDQFITINSFFPKSGYSGT